MPVTKDFAPRLLPAPQAAHYLGVSHSTLLKLSITPRQLGGKRVFDRLDLDAYADELPYANVNKENPEVTETCKEADAAFGVVR